MHRFFVKSRRFRVDLRGMSVVPTRVHDRIVFYETHLPEWNANAAALALSPSQLAAMQELVTKAREAYAAAQVAQQEAMVATQVLKDAMAKMHAAPGAGQDIIDSIRLRAQATDNPNVYNLGGIPEPRKPGRRAVPKEPGRITRFNVELRATGAIALSWTCTNPRGTTGTMYEVLRQIGEPASNQPFEHVATVGEKSIVDAGVPSGVGRVTYQVTPIRSTVRGLPSQHTVALGVAPTREEGARMAA